MINLEPVYAVAAFRTQKTLKDGKGGGYKVRAPPHAHLPTQCHRGPFSPDPFFPRRPYPCLRRTRPSTPASSAPSSW